MKKIWSWGFAAEIFPDILKCLPVTVGSTLVAFVVAALVGLVLAVLLQTKIKWLRKILLILVDLIRKNFDLRPAGIIRDLNLRRPIYKQVASYGHFGRTDLDLPWEKTDKVDALLASL